MRVRLVARLLAVMLASPVVAFTSPGEGLTKAEPAALSNSPAIPAPVRVDAAAEAIVATPRRAAPAGDAVGPAEVRISVDCGHDGCVVQEGLAVLVVADAPRAPAPASHALHIAGEVNRTTMRY